MKRRLLRFVRCFKIWAVFRGRTSFHIFPLCTQVQYFLKSCLEPVGWTGERATLDNGETFSWKETQKIHLTTWKNSFLFILWPWKRSADLSVPDVIRNHGGHFFILWRNLQRRRFPLALLLFISDLERYALYAYVDLSTNSSAINVLQACFCCVGESFEV